VRLKEIVAEHLYLEATTHKPLCPFKEQDSNVRDFYFREASLVLPRYIGSYLETNGNVTKCVRGGLKSFIDAHGGTITKGNYDSLVRRVISLIKANIATRGNEVESDIAIDGTGL